MSRFPAQWSGSLQPLLPPSKLPPQATLTFCPCFLVPLSGSAPSLASMPKPVLQHPSPRLSVPM
eukprot:6343541-Prorocentrum_lima.AAC.1